MTTRDNIIFKERVNVENRIAAAFEKEWGWLVKEYQRGRREVRAATSSKKPEGLPEVNLKPFPPTTNGMIGWISSRPEFKLELYGSDVPVKPLPAFYNVTKIGDPLDDGTDMDLNMHRCK